MNRVKREAFDTRVLEAIRKDAATSWDVFVALHRDEENHDDLSKQIRLSIARLMRDGRITQSRRGLCIGEPT